MRTVFFQLLLLCQLAFGIGAGNLENTFSLISHVGAFTRLSIKQAISASSGVVQKYYASLQSLVFETSNAMLAAQGLHVLSEDDWNDLISGNVVRISQSDEDESRTSAWGVSYTGELYAGQRAVYSFPVSSMEQKIVTLMTCSQPTVLNQDKYFNATSPGDLTLRISGLFNIPNSRNRTANNTVAVASEARTSFGYVQQLLSNGYVGDIYLIVEAPYNLTGNVSYSSNDTWSYILEPTMSSPKYGYVDSPFLFWADSDADSTLLVSANLTYFELNTDVSVNDTGLYVLVYDQSSYLNSTASYLRSSYCAALNGPILYTNDDASLSIFKSGTESAKERWFYENLEPNSSYAAVLTVLDESRSGGILCSAIPFQTMTDDACELIYDLNFCEDVAYSVPANYSLFNRTELAAFYDELAKSYYQNFTFTMQQIDCEAEDEARFSPLRHCADCDLAYKNWLCATNIPRCLSPDLTTDYARLRNPGSSRNEKIDEVVAPGPYLEILPCYDVCWSVMQNCPSALVFDCPKSDLGLEVAYARRDRSGLITCSYLGALYFENSSNSVPIPWVFMILMTLTVILV
ncbi:hypothetical protein CANCADRAFT_32756 [Tortispora caseinolytica NRRL Y-17796]|uniref:FZ domain-containing protein n=1 Tax=Tortispora caseinolytica NRRL Y-17796 TaxID=767744 RepID=A0A1E4TCN4_9ASCO|nr:hypothetical protein CANCADRAFT_32756 [Tortispora caseinolytica NRRL Y-17796]